jgi:tetratricopeptide (TPR) repeat protein
MIMKRKFLLLQALLAFVIVMGFRLAIKEDAPKKISRQQAYSGKTGMMCSPDWSQMNLDMLADQMTVLPGWGNYHWGIKTSNDSAQFYFNQGINMYYAFHIIEAMGSFKKAAQFDENNPMVYWAQALAYGPNINDFVYAANAEALASAQKAKSLAGAASKKELVLINAMLLRYSADSTISRSDLNRAYASSMQAAYKQFPNDADVAALYADALMVEHPWEYWKHDGKAQAWTPEIVNVIERGLARASTHPGLNHYYIHMVEASPNPGKALASADRLGKMMPDVSHMVHMPSHIYIRTGNYEKGIVVNDMSINGYKKYLDLAPDVVNNAFLYLIHNVHMKVACAMMQPNYKKSRQAAADCVTSFDSSYLSLPHPLGNFIQYIYLSPQLVNVRYGRWNDALKYPDLSPNYAFGNALDIWAKGMAQVGINKMEDAKGALATLKIAMAHPDLEIPLPPFNKPIDQMQVGQYILEGSIYLKENKLKEAISSFESAMAAEDKLVYTEPRDWLNPSRHYLAHVLIKDGQYARAKKILNEELKINPNNFYSLSGLFDVSQKENNVKEQYRYNAALEAVYKQSDLIYPALVY